LKSGCHPAVCADQGSKPFQVNRFRIYLYGTKEETKIFSTQCQPLDGNELAMPDVTFAIQGHTTKHASRMWHEDLQVGDYNPKCLEDVSPMPNVRQSPPEPSSPFSTLTSVA
jgi:hypothetical protein